MKNEVLSTAFDEYTLEKQIGQGGNGIVYSASNSSGNHLAIKAVQKDKLNTTQRKRFKNEIRFCQKADHKNIINIIDSGTGNINGKDVIFYVMPLYDCTLRDRMKTGLSPEEIISIFVGIVNGLKYAHSEGTIHRDIKPENILFESNSNKPVIADFGIAHFEEENLLTAVETKAADRLANFQYAAPEQRKRGGNVDCTTDLYSAALILNEMFTGEIPQAADYKKISSINADYDFLDDLFTSLYKQNQSERLQSAEEVRRDLKVRSDIKEKEIHIKAIKSVPVSNDSIPIRKTTITKIEYENNMLIFSIDNSHDYYNWFSYLQNGRYMHTSFMGYGCEYLQNISLGKFGMPLKGRSDDRFIKEIVNYVKEWIYATDSLYNATVQQNALREQEKEEEKRKREIIELEKENSINKLLNDLI